MTNQRLRIGVIGATPDRGWAGMAHVPAIHGVPSLTLQAVATRSERSARLAATAFNAPLWFDDASALIAHKDVDVVVVAVKGPDHYPLVKQALLAGKPVYCEMPFGHTLDEARELERLAREHDVPTAVGLQGRFSPWVQQVREIVTTGRLGRILSTTLLAWDELSLGSIDQGNAYLLAVENGANPLTIHCAHYLDALSYVLGEVGSVSATTTISRPQIVVRQTSQTMTSSSPDQIAIGGELESGAILSFHMRAGTGDPSFQWEIQGEDAVLRVTSKGQLMWRPLRLELRTTLEKRWDTVAPPALMGARLDQLASDSPARFVAAAYEAFATDILTGSRHSATFTHALALRETIETIRVAALTGVRGVRSPR